MDDEEQVKALEKRTLELQKMKRTELFKVLSRYIVVTHVHHYPDDDLIDLILSKELPDA